LRNSKFGVPSGSTTVTYCYYAPARFLKFNPRCGGQGEGSPPAFPALGAGVRVIRSNGQRPPTEAKKPTTHPPTQRSPAVDGGFVYVFLPQFSPGFSISKMTSCRRVFKLQLEVGKSEIFALEVSEKSLESDRSSDTR